MNNEAEQKAYPSNFVNDISSVMDNPDVAPVERTFHDLQEIYVSDHGHTRVLRGTRYGQRYALKCLKPDFLYVPLYRQMLDKEFEIGLQLDHPNICRVIGMEDVDGLGPTIIMDLIDGVTLQELLDHQQLTPDLAHKVASQLMSALRYMHDKQIFHRDLKPSNIMVTHKGHDVKIIDFSLSDSDNFAALKSPAGTMGYIAPEQLRDGATVDARADIYSLGRVLGDMAAATSDRRLKRMSSVCAQTDLQKRPTSIGQIAGVLRRGRERLMMAALGLLCMLLFGILVTGLSRRESTDTVSDSSTVTGVTIQDNEVMDYSQWPNR